LSYIFDGVDKIQVRQNDDPPGRFEQTLEAEEQKLKEYHKILHLIIEIVWSMPRNPGTGR
jgi:hypothetical protein